MIRALSYVLVSLIVLFPASEAAEAGEWATLYATTDGYWGSLTASGELCCPGYTAADPYRPLGSVVTVCYEDCVDVRINDRGANLDLSPAAAEAIGLFSCGRCWVEVY